MLTNTSLTADEVFDIDEFVLSTMYFPTVTVQEKSNKYFRTLEINCVY